MVHALININQLYFICLHVAGGDGSGFERNFPILNEIQRKKALVV